VAKERLEEAINRLEEIVKTLERGDLPLEEALKAFEEGIKLVRLCTKKLEDVERKVEMLVKGEGGELVVVPLAEEKDDHE